MTEIQSKILNQYGIDISKENIFKLYKIDNPGISESDLQTAISSTRKRWNQSINGANERNAERDKARLSNANNYEAILLDATLRKELFKFYVDSGNRQKDSNIDFAKEYFKLVETSKKIRKKDVDFFFAYYPSQRKNRKIIFEMLKNNFKVTGLSKEDDDEPDEIKEDNSKSKKKKVRGHKRENLFQEETIIHLKRCSEYYEDALKNDVACQKYPHLKDGLYDFLGLDNLKDVKQFTEYVSIMSKEVFTMRQEHSADFIPLVDLFNTLQELTQYSDVTANYSKFLLLLKYPTLTPYMFSFFEMEKSTLEGMAAIAKRDYAIDRDCFITEYYCEVFDNFGIISSGGVNRLIKKAETSKKASNLFNIDTNNENKLPWGLKIVELLVNWPIYITHFVFIFLKLIFASLHKLAIPTAILAFVLSNAILPQVSKMENMLYFTKILTSNNEWVSYVYSLCDKIFGETNDVFELIMFSLIVIILTITICVVPAIFSYLFVTKAANNCYEKCNWEENKKRFRENIFNPINKGKANYKIDKKLYFKERIPKIITNFICVGMIPLAIWGVPILIDFITTLIQQNV